jgi:ribosomal protein S18 acetylase RimI-like enzyme
MEESAIERIPVFVEVATLADLEAVAKLRYENIAHRMQTGKLLEKDIGNKTPQEGAREFIPMLEHPSDDEYYLVAREGGEVVGMVGMFWRQEHERFQLRRFYVRTDIQERKIGSQLFRSAKERAQRSAREPKGIFLLTDEDNIEAQEKYEHWGFRKTKENKEDKWIRMDLDF